MPICEADPWRLQYFQSVPCPDDVLIPTEDSDAWQWHPAHRWVYDKLAVAHSQGLEAAPHGVMPRRFPVFSKPICNLRGMGIGSRILRSADDCSIAYTPGHFWMTLLEGSHVSSDAALVDGAVRWWRHTTGMPAGDGTFDHWIVQAQPDDAIESWCGNWAAKHLRGYTGMANFETIGGRIIEVHLRFADQWPDLYGQGWVEAVVRLYQTGLWTYKDADRREGFSVVLFGPHGRHYRHPPAAFIDDLLVMGGISSVQTTFHETLPPNLHAMPPGGFRLAIVNCHDLRAGLAARDRLRRFHGV
jgi:hypothetical protein